MTCTIDPCPAAGAAYWCNTCRQAIEPDTVRECAGPPPEPAQQPLDATELQTIFGVDNPDLLGNKIAALTTALGIPPCAGCNGRQDWVNRAHAWVLEHL